MTKHPLLRWLGIGGASLAAIMVAIAASFLLFQPTLELTPFRSSIEVRLTELTGVPVTVRKLYLKTSLHPSLQVQGLRMAQFPSAGAEDLVRAESVELQIDLIPLLKRRIAVAALVLDQATVEVRPLLGLLAGLPRGDERPGDGKLRESAFQLDALENVDFRQVQLNFIDAEGDPRRVRIETLRGGISRSLPLRLEAGGDLGDTPFHLVVGGPTLSELLAPSAAWPVTARLEVAGARALASGTWASGTLATGDLARQPSQAELALEFKLQGDDLQANLALAGVETPSLGPVRLQGDLLFTSGSIRFDNLEGEVGHTELRGGLWMDLEGERPYVSGHLSTGWIDLEPWLELRSAAQVPASEEEETSRRRLDQPLPTDLVEAILTTFDADVEVAVDGVDGLPSDLEELKASPKIQDGRLTLPFDLRLAGARVEGKAEVASAEGLLQVALDFSSATLPLDQLTDDLGRGRTTGSLGAVELTMSSYGTTVSELLRHQTLHLETGGAHIRFSEPETERQVEVTLSRMELDQSPQAPIRVILDGHLHGHPYRIEAASRSRWDQDPGDPWLFTVRTLGLGSRMRIDGSVVPAPGALSIDLAFDIFGDRIGELEPWLGVSAGADYPYRFQGRLIHEPGRSELRLDQMLVGQSAATMTLVFPQAEEAPILVDLEASSVFPDELKGLAAPREDDPDSDDLLAVDIPIWTRNLALPDAVVNVEVERLARGSAGLADLSKVIADLEIHESRLQRAGFSVRAEEARLRGGLDLDWETEPPEMTFDIIGQEIDLGRLVDLDGYARDLEILARRFDLEVAATGQTLRQMFREGAFVSGTAEELSLSIPSLDQEQPSVLVLRQAEIFESRTAPITVKADGLIGEWPVDLELRLHNKNLTGPDGDLLPVELWLRAGDVRMDTSGNVKLPATSENLDLSVSLAAETVSSFEPLVGWGFSTAGPVRATGQLSLRPDSYALRELSVTVGESDISGDLSLSREGTRPRLIADLSSRLIDVTELLADTATVAEIGEGAEGEDESSSATQEQGTEGWLGRFGSNRLAKVDVDLNLQIDEIQWWGTTGGGGEIRARLEEGRIIVGPFNLELAEGRVEGQATLVARDGMLDVDLGLTVGNVQYGPLLRVFDSEATGGGRIDLQARLKTASSAAGRLLPNATGELRFAAFPDDIDMALFDFWAAGLVDSVIRLVDPTTESTLNCVVGDFSIADGRMTIDTFWLDSSRVRARGGGSVDLDGMTLDLTLRPRPKKRTFLSLATPAKIRGTVKDPSISLTSGGIAGTAFRIYMWFVTVYAQVLKKPLPTDGSDICFIPPPPEVVDHLPGEPATVAGDPSAGAAARR